MSWMEDAPDYRELGQTRQVAKKDHGMCPFCKKPILKGEKYDRTVYLEDGKFGITKMHDRWGHCGWAGQPND